MDGTVAERGRTSIAADLSRRGSGQIFGIFRQPEVIVGTWRAARAEHDDITEEEAREALLQLDPLWDELFPAEQARIVRLLVEQIDVRLHGVEVRLRPSGAPGWSGKRQAAGERRRDAGDGLGGWRDDHRVHIPLTFKKRGGRKLVVTPDGAAWAPRPRVDNAMVKALARAFRWRRMLDEGVHATLEDLAKAKGIGKTDLLVGHSQLTKPVLLQVKANHAPLGPSAVFLGSLTEDVLEGREPVYNRKPGFKADFLAAVSITSPNFYRTFASRELVTFEDAYEGLLAREAPN